MALRDPVVSYGCRRRAAAPRSPRAQRDPAIHLIDETSAVGRFRAEVEHGLWLTPRSKLMPVDDELELCHDALIDQETSMAPEVTIDLKTALLIRKAFVPTNPRRMRNTTDEVRQAALRFIEMVEYVERCHFGDQQRRTGVL